MNTQAALTRRDVLKAAGVTGVGLALAGGRAPALLAHAATRASAGADAVTLWTPVTTVSASDPILQAIEKATNTTLNMQQIDATVYSQRLNASIATGSVPDIIALNPADPGLLARWASEGVIAPFTGKVAAAAPNVINEYKHQANLVELEINGKIYQQPIYWGTGTYPNLAILHVRKDLLDTYGMAPPDTFNAYFAFVRTALKHGEQGVLFDGGTTNGVNWVINAFAGAHGLPYTGWVKVGSHWENTAIQPGMKEALLLFRTMVAQGLVNPVSWSTGNGTITARDLYVAGKGAALIFNGGGHTGRIQNDMDLTHKGYKEYVLPAPTAGAGHRGYTGEPQFGGTTILGNLHGNNPEAAARVINYLLSDAGTRLTVLGIKGRDYAEVDGKIQFLPGRAKDGFPASSTGGAHTGAHPLASAIVTWVPQSWQDFQLLYGQNSAFASWYHHMWANQGKYQIPGHGQNLATPLWGKFVNTGADLQTRMFLKIVRDSSAKSAAATFDQFVQQWKSAGGTSASAEMSEKLSSLYK